MGAISSPCAVSCWGQAEKAAARGWGAVAPRWLGEVCDVSESSILPDLHRSLCRENTEQNGPEIHWAARHPANLCVAT